VIAAANPLSSVFQALLDAIGAVLAFLYKLVPNYGVAIILLTLALRALLLPLSYKQIRSMQATTALQPKIKAIQQKYKGRKDAASRQKMNEETMKLYREHGVNPLSGCLPLLAQMPILIALYAVLSVPNGLPHVRGTSSPFAPEDQFTRLYRDLTTPGQAPGINFLGANLICSAREAGSDVPPMTIPVSEEQVPRDCGHGWPLRIPFYVFMAGMIVTTYYQQRQMQRASPTTNPQQQMLTRIMPVFFGFIGFSFPAGLVVYWTTQNIVQIAQQRYLLPRVAPAPSDGKGGTTTRAVRSGDGAPGKRPSGPAKPRPAGTPPPRGKGQPPGTKPDGNGKPGAKGGKSGGGQSGTDRKKRRKR
jgi:YidC/Oxa1 family membrane protein insertase